MCCFSRPVKVVADTNIFARSSKDGRQFLVYSMRFDAAEDLAMILPIPVPKTTPDDAVKFINLEKYPDFFDDLRRGFPEPRALAPSRSGGKGPPPPKAAPLPVVEVGDFVASFVPSVKDFARLDEQFRLPTDVWDKLPQYKEFGFAVFKLKKGNQPGEKKVHPMAFEFPRADGRKLFFPTVHIHDGTVKDKARFDHALFAQASAGEDLTGWEETPQPAGMFMTKLDKVKGLVDPEAHCYRKPMRGVLKNEDMIV
jgi:hypothetical protein